MERIGPWRFALIASAAVLLGVLSVRDLSVRAPLDHPLSRLASFWANHPEIVERRVLMLASNAALQDDRAAGSATELSRRQLKGDPLAVTPLLLAGGRAQLDGNTRSAAALYRAARDRDPRNPAARTLLADLSLRSGQVEGGLQEMLALSRIAPSSAGGIATPLAAYAKTAGAEGVLKPLFAEKPELAAQVLPLLARDARNAETVLSLAPRAAKDRPWEATLIDSLVNDGQLRRAKLLWHRFARLPASQAAIQNPTFANRPALPPFNWQLIEGSGGVAEFSPAGGLSIVYYGRDTVDFARQLIMLEPGLYRVSTSIEPNAESASFFWRVRCHSGERLAEIPLNKPGEFQVPPNCAGQWLELFARPLETATTTTTNEVQLRKISIVVVSK